VFGSAATFLNCVRETKAACQIGPAERSSARLDQLFQEQRWEQITRLPVPAAGQRQNWLRRGIAFAKLGDCQQAIPALERGIPSATSNVYASFQLSQCYSELAGRTAEQVQASGDNPSALHIMRGDIFLRLQSKPELAIHEYEQALAANGNDPSVLERLAEAQLGAGKQDTAQATAQAALKIDPQSAGSKRTLAKIAMQGREYAAALPYLKELAARNPNDVAGRVQLGEALAQTGALEQALQNLAPALEQGYPDEKGTLHYLLGTVLKKMGRNSDAEKAFATASQLSDAFQQKSYHDQDADAQP
jgi:tetratricopeptide (TPR) repeat protein